MNIDPTDPRLTAYALGELSGDALAEFEALLNDDPDARAEVESIRKAAGLLTAGLATELPAGDPNPARVTTSTPMTLAPPRPARRLRPATRALLAAAASVAIAGAVWTSLPSPNRARESARYSIADGTSDPAAVRSSRADPESHVSTRVDLALKSSIKESSPATGPAVKARQEFDQQPLQDKRGLNTEGDRKELGKLLSANDAIRLPAGESTVGARLGSVIAPATVASEGTKGVSGRTSALRSSGDFAKSDALEFLGDMRAGTTDSALSIAGERAVVESRRRGVETDREFNTESYDRITDNSFLDARTNPLSTFSIDVDTASYSNVRRFLTQGQLPPKDAVRIEEMVNYFPYGYAPPAWSAKEEVLKFDSDGRAINSPAAPFAAHTAVTTCPWNERHRLVRVALKGKEIPADQRPASNLVFLLDVSGSMNQPNKLPLVKESIKQLVHQLTENDRVSIAVYAGNSGLVLQPTRCNEKETILRAIDGLQPGGSTNGASGITLAYDQAVSGFIKDGTNRVILCTDGDFNVGITDPGSLTRLIEEKAKTGVFLSVLGFGMGNTKDSTMEKLADKGNGNYAYIDTLGEGRKVLVEQMAGTLMTIAKDVKIQIEFNPAKVGSYRLVGYENRVLAKEDFNNDKKDAGEIGAGHTVTALYEIAPVGEAAPETMRRIEIMTKELDALKNLAMTAKMPEVEAKRLAARIAELEGSIDALKAGTTPAAPPVDPLKYQAAPAPAPAASTDELLTLKLRYKPPTEDVSKLLEFTVADRTVPIARADEDMRFAASVASFGMLLRDSEHKGASTFSAVRELARGGVGADASGYRKEFLTLVDRAESLAGGRIR